MMIIGSSGSFKTTSIMHQNLLQMGSSYVVLDVKGDTQRKLGKIFEKMVIRYSRLTSKPGAVGQVQSICVASDRSGHAENYKKLA